MVTSVAQAAWAGAISATFTVVPAGLLSRAVLQKNSPVSAAATATTETSRDRPVTPGAQIAATAAGTASTRNSTPQPPVTDASCRTTGRSAWVVMNVPIRPVGLSRETAYSATVHRPAAASTASTA